VTKLTCLVLVTSLGACSDRPRAIVDPIADVPPAQQRAITRNDLKWQWPLTVGTGTLGCEAGAVVFRAAGATYAVNDAARARGFRSIEPIHLVQGQGLPTNPLKGLSQDRRMQVFQESAACGKTDRGCKAQVRARHRLSDADLAQIDAVGVERLWPPLPPQRKDLGPLTDAGLKLCQG
jgi:hypothetical protein